MIVLKSDTGLKVELKGRISRVPSKRGLVVTETSLGVEKSENTRSVVNISVNIQYITEDEYFKLETMFMTANSIDIEDSNKGVYYSKYYIVGADIQLEEKEDVENNAYYYVGGIQLNKR